jgi:hypothetical protein
MSVVDRLTISMRETCIVRFLGYYHGCQQLCCKLKEMQFSEEVKAKLPDH